LSNKRNRTLIQQENQNMATREEQVKELEQERDALASYLRNIDRNG